MRTAPSTRNTLQAVRMVAMAGLAPAQAHRAAWGNRGSNDTPRDRALRSSA